MEVGNSYDCNFETFSPNVFSDIFKKRKELRVLVIITTMKLLALDPVNIIEANR